MTEFFMRTIAHQVDQVIMISPLKTGWADDVTERIRIDDEERLSKLAEKKVEFDTKGLLRN